MPKIRRIFLECTHTYDSGLNTGIQRVVRNIVNESKGLASEIGVECQPVIYQQGRFMAVKKIKNKPSLRARIVSLLKKIYRKLRPILKIILPFPGLERFLLTGRGRAGFVLIVNFIISIISFPALLINYLRKKVVFRDGDLLLMLDSSWAHSIWPGVTKAKNKGAKVALVVYDIFQVTHVQFFVPAMTERFRIWLDQAVDNVDFFIGISETTRNEMYKYVKSKQPTAKLKGRFESFRLGSVMDMIDNTGKIRDELIEVFGKNERANVYLTVGTVEPRKNHKYLLEAFDLIWKEHYKAGICIVGRLGWFCDELRVRLKTHPQLGKHLFLFHDLTDTELDYCYRHAKALVYPSLVEGFGLPIVEALYKKLPVLASDIPIFREVGRDFCTYFDTGNSSSLAKILVNIEKEGKMPKVRPPGEYELPDWKKSARELFKKAINLYEDANKL